MKRGEDDQARDGEAEELSGLFRICRRDGWRSSDYCSFGIPFFPDDIEGALQKLKLPQRAIPFFTSGPNADSVGVTTCSWALRRRRLSDRSGHLCWASSLATLSHLAVVFTRSIPVDIRARQD